MKRICAVCLIVVVSMTVVMPASAQLFGIGGRAGLNISNLSGDFDFGFGNVNFSPKTGIMVGGSFNIRLIPFISLQPEIIYTEKGAKLDEIEMLGQRIPADGSVDLTYLEVPILLKARLPVPGLSPIVYAGPAIAFNLDAGWDSDIPDVGGIQFDGDEIDLKDYVKSTDLGFVFGAGIEFGAPVLKINLEARYTMGITELDDSEDFDLGVRNNVISIILGVTF